LVSLRDPHDKMAAHERQCFATRAQLSLDAVGIHFVSTEGRPTKRAVHEVDAVFFGGSGSYSVLDDLPWITTANDVLQQVLDSLVPAWASCFGFQGLAVVLGGEVVHDDDRTEMGATEIALTDAGMADPLLGSLPRPLWVQEGHHDVVTRLPPGVSHLARSELCEHQAFRVDGSVFWASQFHPELTPTTTADRFRHYRDEYLGNLDADATIAMLERGRDTPELAHLLGRLVRREF
jgi:GMP synthase (glutamine-hydrolysing)